MPEYSRSSSVLEKLADLDGHEKKIKWYVIMSSYLIRANRQPYYAWAVEHLKGNHIEDVTAT